MPYSNTMNQDFFKFGQNQQNNDFQRFGLSSSFNQNQDTNLNNLFGQNQNQNHNLGTLSNEQMFGLDSKDLQYGGQQGYGYDASGFGDLNRGKGRDNNWMNADYLKAGSSIANSIGGMYFGNKQAKAQRKTFRHNRMASNRDYAANRKQYNNQLHSDALHRAQLSGLRGQAAEDWANNFTKNRVIS